MTKAAVQAMPAADRRYVKLSEVRPDPDQPRKVFDPAKIQELAQSIKEQGIIQDLLVVYRPGVKVSPPDLVEKSWQAIEQGTGRVLASGSESQVKQIAKGKEDGFFQILDGERRWRAAEVAGLKEVPISVRQLDEKRKLALQVITNQQREALSALEEAEAFKKEIDSGRHTAESLYKELGISRGKLFSRLALLKLHGPVRKALESGKISVSVASLFSVIPEKKAQEELLERISDEYMPLSFREVQDEIEENYCKQLKGAPFDAKVTYDGEFKDKEDGMQVTVMLHLRGTCEACRFRSGNLEGVETGNPNVCTRPKCYEAKAQAAWKLRAEKAEQKGQRVVEAGEWKKLQSTFVFEDQGEYIGGKYRTWKDAMGGKGKEVERVLVQTPAGPRQAVARKDAQEAAKANGVKLDNHRLNSDDEWQKSLERRRKKAALLKKALAEKILPLVMEKVRAMTPTECLRVLAPRICHEHEFLESRNMKATALKKTIDGWSNVEVQAAVMEAQFCSDAVNTWEGEFNSAFEDLAKHCKVDADKLVKEYEQENEPKKGGKKKK